MSGVGENCGDIFGEPVSKFELVKIRDPIRIFVNNMCPWLLIDKAVDLSFEITNVMVCASQHQPRTSEKVGHAKIQTTI
jgi:protein gp37